LGRKKKGPYEYRLRWDSVVYEPGELRVVSYKDGKPWATDTVRTAGAAARLSLQADRYKIRAGGKDLSFIMVRVVDAKGVLVPRADNEISFEMEGRGEIVATDNGDPADLRSFGSRERKAFNGMALVIVRAMPGWVVEGARGRVAEDGRRASRITVTARSKGLGDARIVIDLYSN
jgi:beta-galactosidase